MTKKRSYAFEDVFGALLLIAGLAVLGLFNFKSEEPLIEAGLRAQSSSIVAETVHGLQVEVEGRHMRLTGLADSEAEKSRILTALRGLEGRGRIETDVTVLDAMTPFEMTASYDRKKGYELAGAVPTQGLREAWREDFGDAVDALTLASGMPDADWPLVAHAGLRALQELETGQLSLTEQSVALTGTALRPTEMQRTLLLVSDLPDSYAFTSDLEALDDGSPLRLSVGRVDGTLSGINGKLPEDLMGIVPEGKIEASALPAPMEDWAEAIAQGVKALNQLHNGHLAIIDTSLTLTGEARSQRAYDQALALLSTMPDGLSISHNLTLSDTGEPFRLNLDKTATGLVAKGKVPVSLSPPVLAALSDATLDASELEIAQISPGQDWWTAASLGTQAMRFVTRGSMVFDGVTLTMEVTLQNPDAETRMRKVLVDLPDAVQPNLTVILIDDGTPLRMSLSFDGNQAIVTGKLPERLTLEQLASALGAPVQGQDVLRAGQPGPLRWSDTAMALARILNLFEEGRADMLGTQITLTGVLRSPMVEQDVVLALAALPAQYNHSTEITFRDDSRPFAFTLVFDGAAAALSGTVPQDLGPSSQQVLLGWPVRPGDVTFASRPADAEWWAAARVAIKALSVLENGELRMDSHQINLTGQVSSARMRDGIIAQTDDLRQDFIINLDLKAGE